MSVEIELYDSKNAKTSSAPSQDVLGEHEKPVWESFQFPKRRDDWMAGRIAAKRLLQRRLADGGTWISMQDIQIRNHPSGEPYVSLPQPCPGAEYYPISISHSNGLGACALGRRNSRIGIDLEVIADRSRAWLELMAHETERPNALASDPTFQTTLWTLKEAVMKVLGIGATVDFWDIRFPTLSRFIARAGKMTLVRRDFDAVPPEFHGKAMHAWVELGSPAISHETTILNSDQLVLSVAYTPPGGSIHGN